ncbi:DUF2892 domain-containing protein [Pseudomonas sp. zfem005]|uniref:YgaP family membrane protein n=1 Tax=Pseudomonas sp. zfem005 TaxID=3078200 RepID=UPI00292804E7|nr:DUF2892 domain-containing protein [Pseudomonas sp. zfem005]MDU9412800.1 DUF2892 domain-containing protein [Pseudomonas sp. zfem005]
MVAFEPQSRENAARPHNVEGWERFLSIAGGLVMVGTGLRQGGLVGWLRAGTGGVVLARGLTGQCPAKRVIAERRDEIEALKARIEEAAAKLAELHRNA